MKRILLTIISLLMICSVFCLDVKAEGDDEETIYPIPDDYVEPEHYYTDEEIELLGNMAQLLPGDEINVFTPILAGDDSGTFSDLSTENMDILFNKVKTTCTVLKETYSGIQCYKFVVNDDVLYVPASYMYRTTSGTCSLYIFNTTMTNRLNYSNTSPVTVYAFCSYKFIDNNSNIVYRFNIAKLEGTTHIDSGISLITGLEIVDTVAFDVYDNFITCLPTVYTSVLKVKPTITVKEKNTGSASKSLYFDSYYVHGIGESSSTTDLSALISLGKKAYELFSTDVVNHDPIKTFMNIFNTFFELFKTNSGGRAQYDSLEKPVSNPAENVYTYNCKIVVPYYMKANHDIVSTRIALSESRLSTTRFQIIMSFSITH